MGVASDLVDLAGASALLGVSAERVRQLVVAGDLPGVRFGNAWVVPRDAVAARQNRVVDGGRPLGPVRAWVEIVAGRVDPRQAGRFLRRARLHRCDMSRADVEVSRRRFGSLLGGARAAAEYGQLLSVDDSTTDLYLSSTAFAELGSTVALVPDPLGFVAVRVVDDDAWALIERSAAEQFAIAPRGVVVLDLLESGDPRHWIAAERLTAAR